MRNLDPAMSQALQSGFIVPAFLAMLTFKTSTQYVWTGTGTLMVGGQAYAGLGSLAQISTMSEGVDVQADGTAVSLSGIDKVFLSECMTDIQLGAPAKIWMALMQHGSSLIGSPYLMFSGFVDQPAFSIGADAISITLALESRMSNLARPNMRRYTSADQRLMYPDDTAFSFVELLNDIALIWGA